MIYIYKSSHTNNKGNLTLMKMNFFLQKKKLYISPNLQVENKKLQALLYYITLHLMSFQQNLHLLLWMAFAMFFHQCPLHHVMTPMHHHEPYSLVVSGHNPKKSSSFPIVNRLTSILLPFAFFKCFFQASLFKTILQPTSQGSSKKNTCSKCIGNGKKIFWKWENLSEVH